MVRWQAAFAILVISLLLASCTATARDEAIRDKDASDRPGQRLAVSAYFETAGDRIDLEVAKTPRQQAIGLMFRTELPRSCGMLFDFGIARPGVRFWMKNTLIPLDMIFLQGEEIRAIVPEVPPCESDPCPSYGPASADVLVDRVIELRAGRAAELDLNVGDRLLVFPRETDVPSSCNSTK